MKKLLLPFCLLLAGVTSNAQGVGIGLRAGLNFANQVVSSGSAPSSYTGFIAGGYVKIMFGGKLGMQPELFYNSVGAKYSGATNKTNYLSLPVLFRFNIIPQLHLLAGPQYGLLLSAKDITSSGTIDIKDDVNTADFGGVIGAGVDFGPFNAGLRYNFGLANVYKNVPTGESVKNATFQIVAGFKLFGK